MTGRGGGRGRSRRRGAAGRHGELLHAARMALLVSEMSPRSGGGGMDGLLGFGGRQRAPLGEVRGWEPAGSERTRCALRNLGNKVRAAHETGAREGRAVGDGVGG